MSNSDPKKDGEAASPPEGATLMMDGPPPEVLAAAQAASEAARAQVLARRTQALQATQDPAPAPAASAPAPAAATPARSLDEVEKAFEARREAFRRANSARRSQHAGAFNVTVTFAPTGEVVECRMLSTDFGDDPSFNAAVMAEVWRLRIPPRPGAREFVVSSYPIAFSARSEAVETPPSMPIVSPPPVSVPRPAAPAP